MWDVAQAGIVYQVAMNGTRLGMFPTVQRLFGVKDEGRTERSIFFRNLGVGCAPQFYCTAGASWPMPVCVCVCVCVCVRARACVVCACAYVPFSCTTRVADAAHLFQIGTDFLPCTVSLT
jgi:hypothetical protein